MGVLFVFLILIGAKQILSYQLTVTRSQRLCGLMLLAVCSLHPMTKHSKFGTFHPCSAFRSRSLEQISFFKTLNNQQTNRQVVAQGLIFLEVTLCLQVLM